MLKHYSHIGMEAKQRAVEALVAKKAGPAAEAESPSITERSAKESTQVAQMKLNPWVLGFQTVRLD
jgi:hypothetical protein